MATPFRLLALPILAAATMPLGSAIAAATPQVLAVAPDWVPPPNDPLPDLAALSPAQVVDSGINSVFPVLLEGHPRCSRNHDPVVEERLLPLWNRYAASLDSVLQDAAPEIRTGRVLPTEILELRGISNGWLDGLREGRISFLRGKEEYYRAAQLLALGMIAGASANRTMIELIERRANTLPPTKLDLVAFIALRNGMGEIGPSSGPEDLSLERIAPLATAPNPICRLLALRAMASALPQGVASHPTDDRAGDAATIRAALAKALLGYADETDPFILEEVIETLGNIPCAEAERTLEQIRARQAALGRSAVDARIAATLEELRSALARKELSSTAALPSR
jgi:hypothetical protein